MRFLLLPASLIYYLIISVRNKLYDFNVLKSHSVEKSIGIGNLSMGGTGKTPLTLFLASWLADHNQKVAILSRGYKRTSKGFIEVLQKHKSHEVGDEPLMYKKRLGDLVKVFVTKNRYDGSQIVRKDDKAAIILFDDVFQHRIVNPSISIIASPYSDIFHKDFILPVGRLREPKSQIHRAQCIVVTGCPTDLSESAKEKVANDLSCYNKPVFYSTIHYDEIKCFGTKVDSIHKVLLVTGIANNEHLVSYLKKTYEIQVISYPDHYNYTENDIRDIHEKFGSFADKESIVLTTEKDMMRMLKYQEFIDKNKLPMYYQPISIHLQDDEKFKSLIEQYVGEI